MFWTVSLSFPLRQASLCWDYVSFASLWRFTASAWPHGQLLPRSSESSIELSKMKELFKGSFWNRSLERRLLYILRDSYITYVFILFSDFQMLWRINHIKQNEAPCAMRKHRTPATSGLPWAPWSFGRALECESPLPWGTVQHVQPDQICRSLSFVKSEMWNLDGLLKCEVDVCLLLIMFTVLQSQLSYSILMFGVLQYRHFFGGSR